MPKAERKRRAHSSRRIRLHFLGATRSVTGSLHFFEVSEGERTVRFFCDFGLNQEDPSKNRQNRLPAGIKMSEVDFGIVSHTHIDHVGAIPHAVKLGFTGPIYATPATCELAAVLLPDCAYLQEEEAARLSRRKRLTVQPLYTQADAKAALTHFQPVEFNVTKKVAEDIAFRFTPASHVLGAAVVTLELGTGSNKRRIVLSGDLGRPDMPILMDLAALKQADYVICEGTYGNRAHPHRDRQTALAEIINAAYERAKTPDAKFGHGVIVIPAFAVGRVQSVLYDLRQLMADKRIPNIPVFVDSPMAIKATAIYRSHPELFNKKAVKAIAAGADLFTTPRFAELPDWHQSVKLDAPPSEPIIIVGSSGMAAGGRIVRHLENRLPGKQNTVVFIGYQGLGTLGRQIVQPAVESVRIGGKEVRVRATIEHMDEYSGHADYNDIVRWLKSFQVRPKKVFLVHGDDESLGALKQHLERSLNLDVVVPSYRESFDLA